MTTLNRIYSIYFSPTGNTKTVVKSLSHHISTKLALPESDFDFTLPESRTSFPLLSDKYLVIFGMPTYAGRLPNLMLKYLDTIEGNGALAVGMVTFGNRSFDNSLAELCRVLEVKGFQVVGGGGFCGEHSFSCTLGKGRPNLKDMEEIQVFAEQISNLLKEKSIDSIMAKKLEIIGDYNSEYYKPRDRFGNFIDIRKVKPKTNDECINCGLCAEICPMGVISKDDFSLITGICIKCCACEKRCPAKAKYFDDAGYIYHRNELEAMYGNTLAKNYRKLR